MNIESAVLNTTVMEAHQKWAEYRQLVKSGQATSAETLAATAFREMTRPHTVIDLTLAIQSGGLFESGLPKLAIARAHWPFVHAWWSDGRVSFTRGPRRWSTRGAIQQQTHNPRVLFSEPPWRQTDGKAQVPSVPPALRPRGSLSRYHILFEAKWEPVPPVDPLLLSHLGGPFYVVRAQWALTPLEQGLLRAGL
ncbi:MAG TPA: hypothetical protein VGR82_17475 [Methylomirabilota bacterium]|jgi:hypothetical protein|nr:hypothetical protein [Methylomirabilota bacterium]